MNKPIDTKTRDKWDKAAPSFDFMAGLGAEKRWAPDKMELFSHMEGKILFLALGTGLDIPHFPSGKNIETFDISPKMLERAQTRIEAYEGNIVARVMDVHDMDYPDDYFDQIYTSCTFCSVPNPVEGLKALHKVLKPGGELRMFEHTGSRYFPINIMMHAMTQITKHVGPDMNRTTVQNVRDAGFDVLKVKPVYIDVVKTITARKYPPTSS